MSSSEYFRRPTWIDLQHEVPEPVHEDFIEQRCPHALRHVREELLLHPLLCALECQDQGLVLDVSQHHLDAAVIDFQEVLEREHALADHVCDLLVLIRHGVQ